MTGTAQVLHSALHTAQRAGPRRLPFFTAAAAAVAFYASLDVAWMHLAWGGANATRAFSDLSAVLCASAATVACIATWRGERGERRRAWGVLALAVGAWAVGETLWTSYELGVGVEAPFPSVADVAFIAGYPLAALAMLMLPASPDQLRSRARTVLDALIVGAALMLVAWATFLGDMYRASVPSLAEQVIGLAYPVSDVVVAAVALFVVLRTQRGRRMTIVLLAAGLFSLAVADSAFAYLTLSDSYATGGTIDAAWDIGYLLIGLAAIRHDPAAPRPERNDENRFGLFFPYVAVILAVGVAGLRKVQDGSLNFVLFWGTLAIVLLVVMRQLITLLDNHSLTRNLEVKVRERTAALQRSEERHRSLVQNSSDVMTVVDRFGVIIYVSPSSERVLGFAPHRIVGRPLVDIAHPDDRDQLSAYLERFMAHSGESPVIEWRTSNASGEWIVCESVGTNLLDEPSVEGFVLNTRDISERKMLEVQLRHQAFHDQLTGSPNRALFADRAAHALRRAARHRRPIAVLYCDLDNLKEVNDNLGHAVGDKLLAEVAERFGRCIRTEDTVARLGGDEFAILLADGANEGAAKHVASRLLKALDEPIVIDDHVIRTSASIGIAISWGRQELDELLRNADLAMYAAKNQGKARFELFGVEAAR